MKKTLSSSLIFRYSHIHFIFLFSVGLALSLWVRFRIFVTNSCWSLKRTRNINFIFLLAQNFIFNCLKLFSFLRFALLQFQNICWTFGTFWFGLTLSTTVLNVHFCSKLSLSVFNHFYFLFLRFKDINLKIKLCKQIKLERYLKSIKDDVNYFF